MLLAAAGVALLVVAAVVFAAVTWQDLGAWPRALILVAVTGCAAVSTWFLALRGLRATAEAVAVLTVSLGLVCVHGAYAFDLAGLAGVPAALYVAFAYTGVVAGAHGLAAWSGVRAPQLVAGLLATIPAPAAVVYLRGVLAVEPSVVDATGLLAAALVTLAYARVVARWQPARIVATVGAGLGWGAAGIASLVVTAEESVALGVVLIVAVGAAAAATSAFGGHWVWGGAAGAALALTVGAVVALSVSRVELVLAAALVSAVVSALLVLVPGGRARGGVLAGAAPMALMAAVGVTGLIAVLAMDTLRVVASPWRGSGSSPVSWPDVTLALLASAAISGVLAAYRRWRGVKVAALTGLGVLAVSALQAGGLDPVGQVALGLVVAAALSVLAAWRGRSWLLAAALVPAGWALAWALSEPWTTVVTLAVLAVMAALPVVAALPVTRAVLGSAERAVAAAAAAACALAVPPTAVAAAGGAGRTAGLVAVVLASAAVLAVDLAVARGRGGVLVGVEPTAAVVALVGLSLAASDLRWLAIALAVAGVSAGAHALRRDRRWSALLSAALLSACSWTLLADARIEVVEAYTAVPAAAALIIGGWWLATDPQARSLPALGAGLALALVPTSVLIVTDPRDVVRVLVLATAAAVVAGAGAWLRWAAPVVYGVGALMVVALTQLGVAAAYVPRWVTFAVLGVMLVAVSATYERQIRRLQSARQRLAVLR